MGKSPLRMVLKNFLDHYEKLEESLQKSRTAIKEMAEAGRTTPPPLSLYAQEFLKLKELTESLKNDINCPMIEGHNDVNKKKNRYKDILPYDNSRVILSEYPGVPGSDYINANYVRGSSGNQRAYIASQGPLPNTLVDFWRMIWETEVLVIVMACNEREAGKYKCEPYWPLNTDEKQQYGNITVEHVKWRQVCPDFLVRTFKVSADNEERTICQFHYTTWPDHGVPSSVQPILELVRLMRDVQSSESRPILVHCSAGCGRTGTLCSIDYVWALLRTGKLREDFSLFDIISDMRRQRIAMVQTVEQYMLCYRAVSTLFEQHLKLIDSHTYENVDDDGEPLGIKDLTIVQKDQNQTLSSSSSSSLESVSISNNAEQILSREHSSANNDPDKESSEDDNNNSVLEETSFNRDQDLSEVRPHEKLIGKATVIRRPSIAKLKAIFDNPSENNNTQQPSSVVTTRTGRLQRSQSIKENFRNFNFNFHLEINQPKLPNRKAKSYTLSAAKLSVYKKNINFANLVLNQENSATKRTKVTDISLNNNSSTEETETHSSNKHNSVSRIESNIHYSDNSDSAQPMVDSSKDANQYQPVISSMPQNTYVKQNVRFNNSQPPLNESNRSGAPPKPPRTYQHILDDSCIIKTSEGRLIVTVAQPIRQHHHREYRQNNSECNYDQNTTDSIYEQLGARKYSYQSSPNLAIASDRIAYIQSGGPGASFNMVLPQVPIKSINFCDNFATHTNAIYSNPLISKSFPLPPTMFSINHTNQQAKASQHQMPQIPRSQEYSHYDNYSPYIDVLNNQHFQNHQAKPIMLQQHGYYEPIYGTTTNNQFLNQRPSVHATSSNIQMIQQPPPIRSKSMSSRILSPNHQTHQHESIYSNREMCYNESHAFDTSIPVAHAKENIYTEIQIKSPNKNTAVQNDEIDKDHQSNKNGTDNNANLKIGRFNKFCRALKIFRFTNKGSQTSKTNSKNSSKNISTTSTNKANTSTTVNATNDSNSCLKISNGVPINPLNGQPLTRPPHSHRFQNATQWTQV